MAIVVALKSEAGGAICLGVTVDEEDFEALDCQAGSQIDGSGGLADSALLVHKSENLTHGNPD
jgi:hypothetical protein